MKSKVIITLLILIGLVGCSNKPNNTEEDSSTKLDHDQIMQGDFSSISGEYVNSKGESVFINNEGLQEGEIRVGDEVYYIGKVYQMSIGSLDSEYGIMITIYPIGVEVNGVPTDTTKIRIGYGNGDPITDEYIYAKK